MLAPVSCTNCHEPIHWETGLPPRFGGWSHKHGDRVCGTGDGSTAYPPINTFHHSRKGPIRGTVVWTSDDWYDIRLHGNQTLRYSGGTDLRVHGDVIRVRISLITAVTP